MAAASNPPTPTPFRGAPREARLLSRAVGRGHTSGAQSTGWGIKIHSFSPSRSAQREKPGGVHGNEFRRSSLRITHPILIFFIVC